MPLLEMKDIHKSYFGVEVLHGVDFDLRPGEVHALIGENGAGKSTLVKILMGELSYEIGSMSLNGVPYNPATPRDALRYGVAKVHQELSLIRDMTVADNMFLASQTKPMGLVKNKLLHKRCLEVFESLGLSIDPSLPMRKLSVSQCQMVEIAKAITLNSQILILDEPTSAITDLEVEALFSIIRQLKKKGVSVVYITHKLEELGEIADRVTVLRDGYHICTENIDNLSRSKMIQAMVGRELTELYPMTCCMHGQEALRVESLTRKGEFADVSFTLKKGEILGISGLMGSGRTELCMAIFGATKLDSGEIWINGKRVKIRRPSTAIKNGLALISEDRKHQGLNLIGSVEDNILGVVQKRFSLAGIVRSGRGKEASKEMVEKFRIKTRSLSQAVSRLSGGNQQKVVIAKWHLSEPDILIFDEPTRGVDVGAKSEIYRIIDDYACQGKAVLIVSSEMPEIIGTCDRVLVMKEGRLTGELCGEEICQSSIMELCTAVDC